MAISIQISEKHLNDLRAFYLAKRQDLMSEIDAVNNMLIQLGESPTQVKNDSSSVSLAPDAPFDYPIKAVWFDKIKYVIELIGGSGTTSDIADKICSIEIGSDRRKVVATISSVLSTNSKEGGAFVKTHNERRESVFSMSKEKQLAITDGSNPIGDDDFELFD